MRLFLAIDIPEEEKIKVSQTISTLKKEYPQLGWVESTNYHITLHFFGERSSPDAIIKKLEELLFEIPTVNLFALGGGIFIHHTIVLYIEFKREKNLDNAVDKIKMAFSGADEAGKTYIRSHFTPHLTIARYKIPSKQQYLLLKKKLSQLEVDVLFRANELHLYESLTGQGRPVYKKIHTFKLYEE